MVTITNRTEPITTCSLARDPLDSIRRKLQFFSHRGKSMEQIARELFVGVPETQLDSLVSLIFEESSSVKNISKLLNAIVWKYPSFCLSPYDQIRRAIVEDSKHQINNQVLRDMFRERALDINEKMVADCHELAYRINHLALYEPAAAPIGKREYTINFLWVNLNPQDRILDVAQNIFKEGTDRSENAECLKDPLALRDLEVAESSTPTATSEFAKIKESFMYRLSKWADLHTGAQINLWYDSALVTRKAQMQTFEMIKNIGAARGVDIKLRDVRLLPNLQGELEHSLHPGTPLYYRVDLLKALIADYMISDEKEEAQYCVVSDIDVEPMPPEKLFDGRTLRYLEDEKKGYVFARMGTDNFENGFFIFRRGNKTLHKVHREEVLFESAALLDKLRKYPPGESLQKDCLIDSQSIYDRYFAFRRKMRDLDYDANSPRKVVNCQKSQFNFKDEPAFADHRSETFRFISTSNVPYGTKGRYPSSCREKPITALEEWKVEILSSIEPLPSI